MNANRDPLLDAATEVEKAAALVEREAQNTVIPPEPLANRVHPDDRLPEEREAVAEWSRLSSRRWAMNWYAARLRDMGAQFRAYQKARDDTHVPLIDLVAPPKGR